MMSSAVVLEEEPDDEDVKNVPAPPVAEEACDWPPVSVRSEDRTFRGSSAAPQLGAGRLADAAVCELSASKISCFEFQSELHASDLRISE